MHWPTGWLVCFFNVNLILLRLEPNKRQFVFKLFTSCSVW